jgi:hypothetical protein
MLGVYVRKYCHGKETDVDIYASSKVPEKKVAFGMPFACMYMFLYT